MYETMIGTQVQNEHGARFTIVGVGWASSAQGPIPCVELRLLGNDEDDTVGVPFDGFMGSFSPVPTSPLVGKINANTVIVVNGDIDTLEM